MLTRRRFLTGLGLGGVVVATPPAAKAFLDVGKARREGEARFKAKTYTGVNIRDADRPWSEIEIEQLERDTAAHLKDYGGTWQRAQTAGYDKTNPFRLQYRDTYTQEDGTIWTVNPETNIAVKAPKGTIHASLSSRLLVANR